ncbi:hypothetical protein AMECASPLE_032869 [Ameca splendens]|uniref:Uncharacterized protein n=1 Tax=Ameca splendens TaxID=208324 RepID=A0ABV1ADR0_9TELE
MPPKRKTKKKGKGKPFMMEEGLSTKELSKDQLWETLLHLQEELQGVRKEKCFFQLERDKSQAALETSKNKLEEAEMQLKNKRRERAEAEERHRLEISVSCSIILRGGSTTIHHIFS